uniref:Uncharacterized protein n=1 Tax=Arundo donax TaxID=35708 RepID=A0A0A9E138_ARUDO
MVYVKAWDGDVFLMRKEKDFTPKKAGRSQGMLNVGSCKMQVTVAWSLISTQRPTENSL